MGIRLFSDHMSPPELGPFIRHMVDWNISVKLVVDGKLAGFYLLNKHSICDYAEEVLYWEEDMNTYKDKSAIQGVGLGLWPEYRGQGYGKLLRAIPLAMDVDYVWGQHFKGLNNLHLWEKAGRRLVGASEDAYFTLIDLDRQR